MRKLFVPLIVSMFAVSSFATASPPEAVAPVEVAAHSEVATPSEVSALSWFLQAGMLNRINKMCGDTDALSDLQAIGDILLAGSVNPMMTGFDASDEVLYQRVLTPSPGDKKTVDQEISKFRQVAGILIVRQSMGSSMGPPVCTAEGPQAAAAFVMKAQEAGVAANAKRMVGILVKHDCSALGCPP